MRTPIRHVGMMGVVAVALFLGGNSLEAQVAVADARPFIGDWIIAVQGEMTTTLRINITDSDGQVAVAITGSEGGNFTGEQIRKEDASLKFSYTTSIQGTAIPAEVTLTPDAEGGTLSGTIDLAAGMFAAPLKATKRE